MVSFLAFNTNPVKRAQKELKKWAGLDESDPAAIPLLTRYWSMVGLPLQPASVPWSAVFISNVAAGYLSPNASHIGYARSAWKDRQKGVKGRYWAYSPNEIFPLKAGDIVIKGRGMPVTWNDVIHDTGHKDSHGDLITSTKNGYTMIGGNVGNSVTEKTVSSLSPDTFAILRRG